MANPSGNLRHGHTWEGGKSPTYRAWGNMIARCTQPSSKGFSYYRKRGIIICDRWRFGDGALSGFECFLRDLGERPGKKREYTLERINNSGHYEPSNCRWATWREQANNRYTNIRFVYRGTEYTLAELSRFTGVSKEVLRSRLCRSKLPWTVEGAVHTPKHIKKGGTFGFCC